MNKLSSTTSILLSTALLATACTVDRVERRAGSDPKWDACYQSFAKHVDRIAGPDAKDCGFWSLGQPKAILSDVKTYAKATLETSEALKFGHSDMGYDSYFCDVAIRDSAGRLWSFFYDSDVSGGSGGPATIWVSECKTIKLEKGTIGKHSFFNLDDCELNDELKTELLADQE